MKAVTLKYTVQTVNEWRAGYSESCKSGSGASVRKPTAAMRQGAGYLAYKSSSSNQQSDMSLLNYDDNNATFEEIVKLALTNNESFDTEKYLGYIYDADDGYVVDVYYKNRDIVTNVAITLYIGTTGEIREIKPHNIPTKSLSNIPIILSKEAITSASESFKSRIAVEEQGKIRSSERVSNQVQFEYYDVTEKTTYLITYTEITDDIGAKYITETVSPIK